MAEEDRLHSNRRKKKIKLIYLSAKEGRIVEWFFSITINGFNFSSNSKAIRMFPLQFALNNNDQKRIKFVCLEEEEALSSFSARCLYNHNLLLLHVTQS